MARIYNKISLKDSGKEGVDLKYTTYDANGLKDKTGKELPHPPHITFLKAMEKLRPHLLFRTEFFDAEKFKKPEVLSPEYSESVNSFRVCGVHVSGEGDKEVVIITGYKTLSDGTGFAFNTPNIRLSSDYKFIKELISNLEELKAEANEYLGGKYGAVQIELFEGSKEAGEPEQAKA